MRASEGMREEAVAALQRRFAEGYLSPATLEERLGRVLRAQTQEALALTLEAELRVDAGICRVRDLGSTNGTYANGRAVSSVRIRSGGPVTFGLLSVELRF